MIHTPNFLIVTWSQSGVLCLDMPRGICSKLLLADLCLFLPHHASSSWISAGYSDKKSETSRTEGLKIHCCHYLHLKHIDRSYGFGDLCPRELHQYWHGDICVLCLLTDNNFSRPDICPKGKNQNSYFMCISWILF